MKNKLVFLMLMGIALAGGVLYGMLKWPPQSNRVIRTSFDQRNIEIFNNSETLSMAIAINAHGSVIGSREIADEAKMLLFTRFFFSNCETSVDMPIPEQYTNVEATAISDNDWVVGYASRPFNTAGGSLHALVWKPLEDTCDFLPPAPGDSACHAQSISSDGRRITGYSTGPQRLRPVLWSLAESQNEWQTTILPTSIEYNPYLMSSSLQISPDGKSIAGCCTEQILPGNIHDSSLYVWQQNSEGLWIQRLVHEEQIYVRDLNNQGEIVGSVLGINGRLPCLVMPDGQLRLLDLLPGDVSGDARGINASSQVVGWSDEPAGPEGGPRACLWSPDGRVQQIQVSPIPYSMLYGINDSGQMAGMLSRQLISEDDRQPDAEAGEVALAFRTLKPMGDTK
jgi:uncharacterized membrane protein